MSDALFCGQVPRLLGAIALAVTLSHFFPVISFIAALQERVMSWGVWAAICYPLLFGAL